MSWRPPDTLRNRRTARSRLLDVLNMIERLHYFGEWQLNLSNWVWRHMRNPYYIGHWTEDRPKSGKWVFWMAVILVIAVLFLAQTYLRFEFFEDGSWRIAGCLRAWRCG